MDKAKACAVAIAASLAISGCATSGANYVPMVDFNHKDSSEFGKDVAECQEFARSKAGANEGIAAGALVGAALMAILAPKGYAGDWAMSGALVGGASGGVGATVNQQDIIKRCLAGRGYNVLS